MTRIRTHLPLLALGLAMPIMAQQPVPSAQAGLAAKATSLDMVVVTPQDAEAGQRNAVIKAETLEHGDYEIDPLAADLWLGASISSEDSSGQSRNISVRGLSSGQNHATLDGISIASVGSGAGERGGNMGMMPGQLGARTEVMRSFSAEQDAGVIGGALNMVTRSAFDRSRAWGQLQAWSSYASYQDAGIGNTVGDAIAHWGGGFKAMYATRFGPDEAFGVVMAGNWQQRANNSGRETQDRKGYFSSDGRTIGAPDAQAGWNGIASPLNFGYASFPAASASDGEAMKLEWRPLDSDWQASLLYYRNAREENRSEISNTVYVVENASGVLMQDAQSGRLRARIIDSTWTGRTTLRDHHGAVAGVQWEDGISRFSLKAGSSRDGLRSVEDRFQARASGLEARDILLDYVDDGLPRIIGFVRPEALDDLEYRLQSGQHSELAASARMDDVRLDYARNADPGAVGFGYVTGVEWRRQSMWRDVQRTVYLAGMPFDAWMYDPGSASFHGQHYRVPWIDGRAVLDGAVAQLAVNEASTRAQSAAQDFGYVESLHAGYFSVHYDSGRTAWLLGLRYDQIGYDALTTVIRNGQPAKTPASIDGGYRHWLPSFNLRHQLRADTNLRLSYSHTLGRPKPSDIAAAQTINCDAVDQVDGEEKCTMSRGNPELEPQRAANLDIAVEKYFADNRAVVGVGWFRKYVRDNIFTLTGSEEIDGVEYNVRQPVNLDDMTLQGMEFVFSHRNLKLWRQGFEASFNASWFDGQTLYVSDEGMRDIERLLHQPKWMVNASLTWRLPAIRGGMRLDASSRSDILTSLGGLKPWEDSGRHAYAMANFALWHRLGKRVNLRYEAGNLFDEQPVYGKGEDWQSERQHDDNGRNYTVHLIVDL